MTINGVLNLCKPVGETSMDMVRMVKRLTKEKKVGHGGILHISAMLRDGPRQLLIGGSAPGLGPS